MIWNFAKYHRVCLGRTSIAGSIVVWWRPFCWLGGLAWLRWSRFCRKAGIGRCGCLFSRLAYRRIWRAGALLA